MAKEGDLIRRSELRRQLVIWSEKLRAAGECGGCEVELLQAVIKTVSYTHLTLPTKRIV